MPFQRPWRFQQKTLCGLKRTRVISTILVCLLLVAIIVPSVLLTRKRSSTTSFIQWVDVTTPRGDHLPDFSSCGYHASEIPLPSSERLPVTVLHQQQGDQTARIQLALNATTAGGGGVVALGEGAFAVSPGLYIPSGVVLRGAGVGLTKLTVSQLGQTPLITVGRDPGSASPSIIASIGDQFVPIGSSKLTVDNVTGFQVGQSVFVQRRVTTEWVRANGMSDLVLNGVPQTWLQVRRAISLSYFRALGGAS